MEHQKQQILQQAEALFLRYGVKSVTMDDLARELGISKKTLYQYVDNKADLISQIVFNHVQDETRCINAIVNEGENAVVEMLEIAKYAAQQLDHITPTVVYDLRKYYRASWELVETLHKQHVYSVIRGNIEKGIHQGVYRDNIDSDIIAKIYVAMTFLMVEEDVFPQKEYQKERLFHMFIQYHLKGIASPKGQKLLEKYLIESA